METRRELKEKIDSIERQVLDLKADLKIEQSGYRVLYKRLQVEIERANDLEKKNKELEEVIESNKLTMFATKKAIEKNGQDYDKLNARYKDLLKENIELLEKMRNNIQGEIGYDSARK